MVLNTTVAVITWPLGKASYAGVLWLYFIWFGNGRHIPRGLVRWLGLWRPVVRFRN